MSGHSKWNSIKHKKGAADAARGKIFTKHAKLIAIAARNGENPELNANLKTAIANAKADNVPNDNIKRAIQKGSGNSKEQVFYHEVAYEGYGQNGVAIIIEALTDNTNRTLTNVRNIMAKNGGNLGAVGVVSWMFKDKGYLELILPDVKNQEIIEMDIIEAGAEDIEFDIEKVFITTNLIDLGKVRDFLINKGYKIENAKKNRLPENYISISEAEIANKFLSLLEKLEEDDDVSEIYHNADISEEIINNF